MSTILLLTTIVASAVALAASVALYVVFRGERRRADARVAALRQLAADDAADDFLLNREPDEPPFADEGAEGAAPRPMFGEADAPAPWGRRLLAAGAVAVAIVAAAALWLPRGSADGTAPAAAAGQAPPLELLSLRHTREADKLIIAGLVQNPRRGVTLNRVVATAFVFDAGGTLVASGRAPLDFSTLAAGDESPFVLTVPVAGPVSRYRIGFRGEDGRVIGHIDRRAAGTLARAGVAAIGKRSAS